MTSDGRFTGDPSAVSARMRLIHSTNTRPELKVFDLLTRADIAHQRHPRVMGIRVDAVIEPAVVLFVDSPFWHLRDPGTLRRMSEKWQRRLILNRRRDRRQVQVLRAAGYVVVRLWSDEIDEARLIGRVRRAVARATTLQSRS